ncbi:S9 family peptidase [Echinicola strongylocentroti]|uniref:S9 family peptidase n=1 Tax=Echinicola strongylocentroti TaxID=1795355 RepID=A0A2Z4IES4_9BACT|nr:prolyl oligopeptidase family serine peptidase [Echinicola strongylocentroti]AWW28943.1 S9 family peptidase [Echinicola strongylocentroti]
MRKVYLLFLIVFGTILTSSGQESPLSVEQIMQDPKWMGTFPSDIRWGKDSQTIYFNYNPDKNPADSLYKINLSSPEKILKVSNEEKKALIPSHGDFNKEKNLKVYTRNGTLYRYDFQKNKEERLLDLGSRISQPEFLKDEDLIAFQLSNNIFTYQLSTGKINKLTNITDKEKPKDQQKKLSEKDNWLKKENQELLQVIQERENKKEKSKAYREATKDVEKFTFYTEKKRLTNLRISPDAKFVTFNLITPSEERKNTFVPDYTDVTGYTTDLDTRPKVGDEASKVEMAIYNLVKDTVYYVQTDKLPGIKDLPDYVVDYPEKEWEETIRPIIPSGPYFSSESKAVVNIRSTDNKDRWIALLHLEDGTLKSLDRQRDEAWIAGPGIGYSFGGGTLGWLPDDKHIYFQSEATGYSHLYLYNIENDRKIALTEGDFEVFSPALSQDARHWYLTTSAVHPGERHFYKMPVMGGDLEQLTAKEGNNKVSLSPDEKHLAILHSYSNQPWELYLKPNRDKTMATQLTTGQSDAFKTYDWKDPELIHFKAQDGTEVPARLYKPSGTAKNGAAVIFVHGAGYLQNAHKWWSSYFREYMFHNLLADLGYTVLDIDYRGSAGYGRDWRTGIYRHMGGKDLSDQVDGAQYLINELNIDSEKIGIYGGSYGGFITLMALFNEADTFTSGAALRSVTDWAHYNHGYTSNILNEPTNDPIAYRRSSPIYFAEGLEGHLLIAHGMVDVNVHFQDVVRLSQRLIELGKDNWEMAVYPVEDHGFVEPSSWTDEYKRILKLFNDTLLD